MKKALRIITPILLVIAIIACTCWYLFVYDREFTRDMLLSCARYSESQGNHTLATWFYGKAYAQSGNSDSVAIELAQQYKSGGNYTKAEYTLSNAIADGGGIDLYIALSNLYLEQDKLLDAVNMLNNVTNKQIKQELDKLRPATPTAIPEPGYYSQYISVTVQADSGTLYVNPNGEYPTLDSDPYSDPIALVDGENNIYALTVSEEGLVSELAIYGYTVGGVVQLMEFQDTSVEALVRELLLVSESAELFTNDLWQIKDFTVPADAKLYGDLKHMPFLEKLTVENAVSSELGFLSSLPNLTQLKITNTTISQEVLQSIAALPSLKHLTLQNCALSNIEALQNTKSLVTLDLSDNTIRNLDPLSGLQNLKELNLKHNAVTSLSALESCTALTRLDISYNSVSSLEPLSKLTGLTWLDAGTNSINQLGSIQNLSKLSYLSLASNKLTSVSAIADCAAITDLNVSSNALTDISALASLTSMLYFDFSHNQVEKLPAFPKDCQLVIINGSHNKLSSLDALSGLEHLNNVHMDYNTEITSVSPLTSCHLLIEVNVYATKVTDVTPLTNQSVIVNYNPVQEKED